MTGPQQEPSLGISHVNGPRRERGPDGLGLDLPWISSASRVERDLEDLGIDAGTEQFFLSELTAVDYPHSLGHPG